MQMLLHGAAANDNIVQVDKNAPLCDPLAAGKCFRHFASRRSCAKSQQAKRCHYRRLLNVRWMKLGFDDIPSANLLYWRFCSQQSAPKSPACLEGDSNPGRSQD
jgi:hypothetical protein